MSLGWFGRGLSVTHGTTLLTTREKKEGFEEGSRFIIRDDGRNVERERHAMGGWGFDLAPIKGYTVLFCGTRWGTWPGVLLRKKIGRQCVVASGTLRRRKEGSVERKARWSRRHKEGTRCGGGE